MRTARRPLKSAVVIDGKARKNKAMFSFIFTIKIIDDLDECLCYFPLRSCTCTDEDDYQVQID